MGPSQGPFVRACWSIGAGTLVGTAFGGGPEIGQGDDFDPGGEMSFSHVPAADSVAAIK